MVMAATGRGLTGQHALATGHLAPQQPRQPQQQPQPLSRGGFYSFNDLGMSSGEGTSMWDCPLCHVVHDITVCCSCGEFVTANENEDGVVRYHCQGKADIQCSDYDFSFRWYASLGG